MSEKTNVCMANRVFWTPAGPGARIHLARLYARYEALTISS